MPQHVLLIRQPSGMRQISTAEVIRALDDDQVRLERTDIEVDMASFVDAVEQGDWLGHDLFLRERALLVRATADRYLDVVLHYFGLAEVPHIVSLGGHIRAERMVFVHDYDRDHDVWRWSNAAQSLQLTTTGTEGLQTIVRARGPAVLRVSISASISDSDVRAVVGDETLADVTIGHALDTGAAVTMVRSAADVEAVRSEFRSAYGQLRNARPNIDVIHLFIAAPPSVCFVVG